MWTRFPIPNIFGIFWKVLPGGGNTSQETTDTEENVVDTSTT